MVKIFLPSPTEHQLGQSRNLNVTLKEANEHRNEWFEGVHTCQKTDSLFAVMEIIVKAEVSWQLSVLNHYYEICDTDELMIRLINITDLSYGPQVHRLVVVDAERRVLGVVSLSDILAYLVLRSNSK